MADSDFSGLPAVTTPAGSDILAVTQGGISKRATLTQIEAFVAYGGATVTSFTPTLTQSGAVTKTVSYARYVVLPAIDLVFVHMRLLITGAGTVGNDIVVGNLPAAIAIINANDDFSDLLGEFIYLDNGSTLYAGSVYAASTTTVKFMVSGSAAAMGTSPSFACANTDKLGLRLMYMRS